MSLPAARPLLVDVAAVVADTAPDLRARVPRLTGSSDQKRPGDYSSFWGHRWPESEACSPER